MKFKRKTVIKYLKIRRDVFIDLVNEVKNGTVEFSNLHPDKNVQVLWIEGRIQLLHILICELERKSERHYIKMESKS